MTSSKKLNSNLNFLEDKTANATCKALKQILAHPDRINIVLDAFKEGVAQTTSISVKTRMSHHQHSHLEMFVTLVGEHKYWMLDKTYTAKAGDIFIIPGGVQHQQGYPRTSKDFVDIWFFRLDKYRFSANEWNFFGGSRGVQSCRRFALEGQFMEIFVRALDYFVANQTEELALRRLHHSIVGILFYLLDMIANPAYQNTSYSDHSAIILEIENYIQNNVAGDLSLKTLAHIAGSDQFYFHKLFKKYTGEPLHSYVNRIRFNKACELLSNGRTATSVGEELGFGSAFYFSRFFTRMAGIPPGRWQTKKIKAQQASRQKTDK